MNQRVMIAMAIACNPKLLIADEPTTALDVTIQAQILDLLLSLQRERGMALILITHNMGVVAEIAQRVVVMYSGPGDGGARGGRFVRRPATSLHRGAAGGAAGKPRRRAAGDHSRHGAEPLRAPARLPVQPALRLRDAALRSTSGPNCGRGRAARCAATTRSAIRRARRASPPTGKPGQRTRAA